MSQERVQEALEFLNLHYESFYAANTYATRTDHPVPTDTRGWSQILASILSGVPGLKRQKGPDLQDGSDVKGANTWEAIDTPRFNGVIKAGTKAETADSIESLNSMPHLYLVLWDETDRETHRCRIWVVRPQEDEVFRDMCATWYKQRKRGDITSTNFQLHPPRGLDNNVIRNNCGNLQYPLYFCAERERDSGYSLVTYDPAVRTSGVCKAQVKATLA